MLSFDLPSPTDGALTLDTREIADTVGIDAGTLASIIGPGATGSVEVFSDEFDEFPEWAIPESSGLFMVASGYSSTLDEGLAGGAFPESLSAAWDRLCAEYGAPESVRYFSRYARLFGYSVREEWLTGYSQGDWLKVLCVETGGEEIDTDQIAAWCFGDVFGYSVSVESPVGDDCSDTLFGLYGISELEHSVATALKDCIKAIRSDIRKAI